MDFCNRELLQPQRVKGWNATAPSHPRIRITRSGTKYANNKLYRVAPRAQSGPDAEGPNSFLFEGKRTSENDFRPSLKYSREEAIMKQLEALQDNNEPYTDHGIEVLYRFAGRHLDPFVPSFYFGRSLDLGQFERFRRIMNTECYRILVNHTEYEICSGLEVSEGVWKSRVMVKNAWQKREAMFEFTMVRELGGRYDGIWFCQRLICQDDEAGRHIYGVI